MAGRVETQYGNGTNGQITGYSYVDDNGNKQTFATQDQAANYAASQNQNNSQYGQSLAAFYNARAGYAGNSAMGQLLTAGTSGLALGNSIFGEGSLGRLPEGYSDAESQALKTKAEGEAANASRQAQRRLQAAQASSNMSGGAAIFQQGELQNQRALQQASVNRDLFLAQEQQRRQDIQFNLGQAAKEKAGQLSTALGFMQMQQGILTGNQSAQAIMNAPTGSTSSGGLLSSIFG